MEDKEVYFTPPHIIDFVLGSGAYLNYVYGLVLGNPPFVSDLNIGSTLTTPPVSLSEPEAGEP